jgi:adenine-specific DNA-methyltransferase
VSWKPYDADKAAEPKHSVAIERETMDKLKMHSPDLTQDHVARLRELFPGCVTEAKGADGAIRLAVDFDLLRQELTGKLVEGPQERYQLNWPGKREALLTANAPIAKTLRPCCEESVDFDTTKNLFIEGDNLDALKLLQETYLGKVKMIYIDPPYNTGNDFIYEDDFAEEADAYLRRSGQKDLSGARLVANPASNGRFHSDWLGMLYSRLRLARFLLADDGVLVASIDDNEVANLKKLFDEVFGEDNFLFQVTVLCNPKGRSQDKYVANCHEYLIGYSKEPLAKGAVNIPKDDSEIEENYKLIDKRGRYRELELRNTHREFGKHNRKNLYYPFFVTADARVSLEQKGQAAAVYPDWDDGFEGCWTWGTEKAAKQISEVVAKQVNGKWKIYRKNYAEDEDGESTRQVKSIWTEKQFHTEKGQAVFNELFDSKTKLFQSPKSVDTIRQLLLMGSKKDSLVIDFFAGSGTTAHAVMAANAEDGGQRRFVLVQLPEATAEDSEAFKGGYRTISDLCKERIRRAGQRIGDSNVDTGFRVLKIDTSNTADVFAAPDAVNQGALEGFTDNIKPDRTAEDLLFQVMLDWGVDLALPITRQSIQGREVLFVDGNALAACFDAGGRIDEAFVKELATHKPLRAVFRDAGFADSAAKINVEQIFKLLSPATEVKCI